jgi:hypothetical protein
LDLLHRSTISHICAADPRDQHISVDLDRRRSTLHQGEQRCPAQILTTPGAELDASEFGELRRDP